MFCIPNTTPGSGWFNLVRSDFTVADWDIASFMPSAILAMLCCLHTKYIWAGSCENTNLGSFGWEWWGFASSAQLAAAYNAVAPWITLAVQVTVITDKGGFSLRFHRVTYRKKYFTYEYLCWFIWRLLSSVSHVGCCLPSCWEIWGSC